MYNKCIRYIPITYIVYRKKVDRKYNVWNNVNRIFKMLNMYIKYVSDIYNFLIYIFKS